MSTTEEWRRAGPPARSAFDDKRSTNGGNWRQREDQQGGDNWRRSGSNGAQRNRAKRESDDGADKKVVEDEKVEAVEDKLQEMQVEEEKDGSGGNSKPTRNRERRFREPEVVNSRAAMLGEAAAPRKEVRSLMWDCV
jgi:hypothetical protein